MPLCFSSVINRTSVVPFCVSDMNMGLCGLVAATNIGILNSQWSCNEYGVTTTDPCATFWNFVACTSGNITSISFPPMSLNGKQEFVVVCLLYNNYTIDTGTLPSSIGHLTKLTSLLIGGNSISGLMMFLNIIISYQFVYRNNSNLNWIANKSRIY